MPSAGHDLAERVVHSVVICRFKNNFLPLSNSREQEEGNESTQGGWGGGCRRGVHGVFKHTDAAAAAAAQ